jgi:hypothetical protein
LALFKISMAKCDKNQNAPFLAAGVVN